MDWFVAARAISQTKLLFATVPDRTASFSLRNILVFMSAILIEN